MTAAMGKVEALEIVRVAYAVTSRVFDVPYDPLAFYVMSVRTRTRESDMMTPSITRLVGIAESSPWSQTWRRLENASAMSIKG